MLQVCGNTPILVLFKETLCHTYNIHAINLKKLAHVSKYLKNKEHQIPELVLLICSMNIRYTLIIR